MPSPVRTTRDQWVAAGLRALAEGGPDAVRVEVLAATLGVTKGGFYARFNDRPTYLAALLDEWERRSVDDTLARVEAKGGEAPERIVRAGRLTFADELLPIDLAVRDWARRDDAVAARLRRVDDRRIAYLRGLFSSFLDDAEEIEARSTLAFTLAIGQHFMAEQQGGRSREVAVRRAAARLLRPST
jgi:AcrR family transcriptional regulator